MLQDVESISDSVALEVDSTVIGAIDIFGSQSTLADSAQALTVADISAQALSQGDLFGIMVLVCFVGYCLILRNFTPQVILLLNIFRGDVYRRKLLGVQNLTLDIFIRLTITLGLLVCGIGLLKYVYIYIPELINGLSDIMPVRLMGILLCLGVWGVAYLIWLYRIAVLRVAQSLIPNKELIEDLIAITKFSFAFYIIIATPLILMLALSSGLGEHIISIILLVQLSLMIIYSLITTILLFVEQKVSILYWFLYLCGVEILPLSFLVLFTLRNMY